MIELVGLSAHSVEPVADLVLTFEQRAKSRLRATLSDGRDASIILPRGTCMQPDDLLSTADGEAVRVIAANESISVATTDDALLLCRASYHLGNRHVALQIDAGRLCYLHDHVLDDMVRLLGLAVTAEQAPFTPESGAYGAHAHVAGNHHGHQH